MSVGLDGLKHIVVLMLENRSFDHMLGSLKAVDPRIIRSHFSFPLRWQTFLADLGMRAALG